MAERTPVGFVMLAARGAINGLPHIEQQVNALEAAVVENPALVFDLAKTLIESVCKAILQARKVSFANDDNLPRLFRETTEHLPFLPPAASNSVEARKSLERTLGGLHTAVQGICELRNSCGFASHGSAQARPPLESVQALLAAQCADAIIGFLYRVHRDEQAVPRDRPLQYDDNPGFNDYIDSANDPVRIFELTYRPSEVLFAVDLEAYRDALKEYPEEQADEDRGEKESNPAREATS
jgi:hypothetical protein